MWGARACTWQAVYEQSFPRRTGSQPESRFEHDLVKYFEATGDSFDVVRPNPFHGFAELETHGNK